ncbi:cell division control protein 6 homolog isoform X2 [Larus michahellis]|uniref:cell division control protein 6 homolog isoform X2 n=1 Tax=Larus michahellis TaxID=119627 RepID=UPI003D9AF6B2
MASSSPQRQPTIGFPRRRSARRLAAPPAKSGPDPPAPRLPPSPRASGPAELGAHPARPEALPLSPRKRLGDDNLCNVPRALPCSPAKRSKENQGRRLLFGDPPASPEKPGSPGLSPRRGGQETPRSSGLGGQPARARLFRQEGTCYQQVKRVLHAAVPDRLHGRERETGVIRQFLREHVGGRRPGSLYISGAPGTGKTACLSRVLLDCKDELAGSKTIVLNCMALSSPQGVFPAVGQQLGLPAATGREGVRRLEKQLTARGPMVLLVLDELDQLESKGQDVLYTLFEWPRLPSSRLVLVGLANALDLTDRSLARLGARPAGGPRLLHFPPYTREQLTAILQERLGQVAGDTVLDAAALQFCARKVSAVSGDARKALDVCRRAVEVVELEVRSQTLLKPLPGAPRRLQPGLPAAAAPRRRSGRVLVPRHPPGVPRCPGAEEGQGGSAGQGLPEAGGGGGGARSAGRGAGGQHPGAGAVLTPPPPPTPPSLGCCPPPGIWGHEGFVWAAVGAGKWLPQASAAVV